MDIDELAKDFAADPKKETDGVWMTYKRHEYLITRAHRNNVAFFKTMEQEMRPFQWALERGNIDAIKDAAGEALQRIYARTILRGIRRLDGTVLDYKADDGVALFKQVPDLWDKVFEFAKGDSNYSPDQVDLDAKNS